MWIVAVVDVSAQARLALTNTINQALVAPNIDSHLLPLMNIVPFALEEVKFHSKPNLVIVGPGLIEQEITVVSQLRAQLPDARILVVVPSNRNRLASIDHLLRLGADDVVEVGSIERDLITRIVLLGRKLAKAPGGRLLVVDGAKGGVGASSIAASIAGSVLEHGKRVALVDLDMNTRALSRYLRARPILNENLQQILDGHRSCSAEFVDQAIVEVETGGGVLALVPPPLSREIDAGEARALWVRNFLLVVELLDQKFDLVVVDLARTQGMLRESLIRAADHVLTVATQDPVCLPALFESAKELRALGVQVDGVGIIRNECAPEGISNRLWRSEAQRIAESAGISAALFEFPFSSAAMRWPGSGETMAHAPGAPALLRTASAGLARWALGMQESTAQLGQAAQDTSAAARVRETAVNFLRVLSLRRGDRAQQRMQSGVSAGASESIAAPVEHPALPHQRLSLPHLTHTEHRQPQESGPKVVEAGKQATKDFGVGDFIVAAPRFERPAAGRSKDVALTGADERSLAGGMRRWD